MCQFFSFVSDGRGTMYWSNRHDSHTEICEEHGLNEDRCNKYEFDGVDFRIDRISTRDDRHVAQSWVEKRFKNRTWVRRIKQLHDERFKFKEGSHYACINKSINIKNGKPFKIECSCGNKIKLYERDGMRCISVNHDDYIEVPKGKVRSYRPHYFKKRYPINSEYIGRGR